MRQIIISLVGIVLIGLAVVIAGKMSNRERPQPKKEVRTTPTVFTETVKNGSTPVVVTASGNLAARDRIEVFSEVQGIFEHSAHQFDAGIYYKEGEVLLRINSDEHRANIRAQKSNLYNQIVAILPDLRFDYSDAHSKWEAYVKSFDIERLLRPLPRSSSDKEKLFIAGKNIQSTWYSIKNLEERLSKYTIYAPFNGILTEALVDKGALVRAGQKLGAFISPVVYELEVGVNAEYADLLKVGNSVELHNVEHTKTWKGRVNRLNSLVNPSTQTIQAFIRVVGKGLREGMYLEANLTAKNESNTYEIPRKLLVDNNKVFYVKDTLLQLQQIESVFYKDKTVVVRGLPDGMKILNKTIPGAYEGMVIEVFSD